MAKKMTKKEFFEIADNALLCVNDFEDVLSYIECDTWEKSHKYAESDIEYSGLLARRARAIHKALAERGYYDKVQ